MRNADWILCLLVGPGSPDGMMHANIGPSPLPPPPPVSSWIHDVSSVVIYAHIFCCVIAVYFYCFFHILFYSFSHTCTVKAASYIVKLFSSSGSCAILVLSHQTSWQN